MFGIGPIEMLVVGAMTILFLGVPAFLIFRVLHSPADGLTELKERVRRLEDQLGDSHAGK
ncbi:MAG TPA: hypothetical protein VGG30_00915 [Pirellulales bacterium]|jgi:hypothetical protein